mmetsp:Transcript_52318/g.117532  ORF Transcript_52318/g.117532 Transcript_52318/m.117532 type:complete len:208 (-) Transcript_52318:228-851(-)
MTGLYHPDSRSPVRQHGTRPTAHLWANVTQRWCLTWRVEGPCCLKRNCNGAVHPAHRARQTLPREGTGEWIRATNSSPCWPSSSRRCQSGPSTFTTNRTSASSTPATAPAPAPPSSQTARQRHGRPTRLSSSESTAVPLQTSQGPRLPRRRSRRPCSRRRWTMPERPVPLPSLQSGRGNARHIGTRRTASGPIRRGRPRRAAVGCCP